MADATHCPHCSADLGNGRAIGVEIWGVYDGVLFWRCPDCGGSWHRWAPDDWPRLYEAAVRYVGSPKKTAVELDAWAERLGLVERTSVAEKEQS